MEKQIERIANALEEMNYTLNEIKRQWDVTNRPYSETPGNIISELEFALREKLEKDMNRHLN